MELGSGTDLGFYTSLAFADSTFKCHNERKWFALWRYRYTHYIHVPTNTVHVPYRITTGIMMDSGSVKTGMYLAIGRLYAGIADCEPWPVD